MRECPAPRSAYGFSKLAGEVYCRALHDEHGLPYTICRPFNAYGPGRAARRRAGHRARGARPDPEGALRPAPAARSSARASRPARSRTWTTSRTGSSPPWRTRPARTRTSTSRRPRSARVAEIARDDLGGVRRDPGGVRAEAPAELRGGRPAPLALGREGAARCSAGRRGSACATGIARHGGVAARSGELAAAGGLSGIRAFVTGGARLRRGAPASR